MCRKNPTFSDGICLLQHRRQQHQVIVVNPNRVALLWRWTSTHRRIAVDLQVLLPPFPLIAEFAGHVMQQRPQAGIGKPVIISLDLSLVQEDRHVTKSSAQLALDVRPPLGSSTALPGQPIHFRDCRSSPSPSSAETRPPEDLRTSSPSRVIGRRLETLIKEHSFLESAKWRHRSGGGHGCSIHQLTALGEESDLGRGEPRVRRFVGVNLVFARI